MYGRSQDDSEFCEEGGQPAWPAAKASHSKSYRAHAARQGSVASSKPKLRATAAHWNPEDGPDDEAYVKEHPAPREAHHHHHHRKSQASLVLVFLSICCTALMYSTYSYRKQVDRLAETSHRLTMEVRAYKEEITRLKGEIKTKEEEGVKNLAAAQEQYKQMQATYNGCKTDLQAAKDASSTIAGDLAKCRASAQLLDKRLKAQRDRMKKLDEDAAQLHGVIKELEVATGSSGVAGGGAIGGAVEAR